MLELFGNVALVLVLGWLGVWLGGHLLTFAWNFALGFFGAAYHVAAAPIRWAWRRVMGVTS